MVLYQGGQTLRILVVSDDLANNDTGLYAAL
jgi:hypothetical protein